MVVRWKKKLFQFSEYHFLDKVMFQIFKKSLRDNFLFKVCGGKFLKQNYVSLFLRIHLRFLNELF